MKRTRRQTSLASALGLSALAVVVVMSIVTVPGEGQFVDTETASVEFTIVQPGICDIFLRQGWNLISLCAEPADKSVSGVLFGIDFRFVMKWNVTSQAFDIYSPLAASNPFDSFEVNSSYFVLLNPANASFSTGLTFNPDLNIDQNTGWNTPAWPYEFDTNITKYFNASVHRYLMKWNAVTQEFEIYSPRAATNPFSTINSTEGQFILATSPNTIMYNRTELAIP